MRRLLVILGAVTIMSMGATATIQCPIFVRPEPSTITVEVVNDTSVALQATFDSSSNPNITQDELLTTGAISSLNVGSGLTDSFDLNCTDAEALILDRADLLVTAGGVIGTNILYQGVDFFCGEVVSFDFTASQDLGTLNVNVTFRNQ